jgi:hypothetical protein
MVLLQTFNTALDQGHPQRASWFFRLFVESASRVISQDRWGYELRRATRQHKANWTVHRYKQVSLRSLYTQKFLHVL